MSWIEINNFTYTYPGEPAPALVEINLALEKDSFAVITGRSGSGKSTLGKALAGFLFADESPNYSGEIIVNGTDMAATPLYEASQRVAYVQQNPDDQFCTLTVEDEIAFGLENLCVHPIIIEQHIDDALSIVEGQYLKDRDLHTLSGGEKQKIAIASMLALRPDVLILDEPTSNLDPHATQNIFETLYNLRQVQGMTIIIIEHKLEQLMTLDPVFFTFEHGRLIKGLEHQESPDKPSLLIDFPDAMLDPAQPLNNPTIQIKNATIAIGDQQILHKLNLELFPGEFIALMGPNGSGKTTLLQSIMGFHDISQGEINLLGQSVAHEKTSKFVRDLGFVFQNPDHQLFMSSVWEETILTAKNLQVFNDAKARTAQIWLEQIGLEDRLEDHPQRLSFGEKRRLNVVASILHHPKLLLIDEILIGQDPINARLWMAFLSSFTALGYTVILAIHHPQLILQFCSRVVFLDGGSILIDDSVTNAFRLLFEFGYHSFLPQEHREVVHA